MICPICGTPNDDNRQICGACGSNMTFRTQEHYEYYYNAEQSHQTPVNQQLTYQQPDYQQPDYQQADYQQVNYQQANYQQANYQQTNYQQNKHQQLTIQQPIHQHHNSQWQNNIQPNDPGKVLGIVGFALAMGSLVFSDGFTLAIVGLILSAVALKQSAKAGFKNGFAKAGLITSIIITVISILFIIAFLAFYIIYAIFILGIGMFAV